MSDDAAERTRVQGVEFGPLKQALREQEYPVTSAELIEQYGGFELQLPDGTDRLEDVLNRVDDVKFREPAEVRDAILAGVDDDAIGREEYSDRDPDGPGADDWDQKSL